MQAAISESVVCEALCKTPHAGKTEGRENGRGVRQLDSIPVT